jgi:hypothetical protein
MLAIEIANRKSWNLPLIEIDSTLVTLAFRNPSMILLIHCYRWLNCVELTDHMFSIIPHIYREYNQCAECIAILGLQIQEFQW